MSNVRPDDRRGDGQAGAELVGLHDGALGQLAAGDAGGEAEVVLDAHAAAGLAARAPCCSSTTVLQPLGGAVDRRGQPRRPGPDHDQVVDLCSSGRRRPRASASSRFEGLRRSSLCPQATTGVSASVSPNCLSSSLHLRVGLQVQPGERHPVLGQEVADPEGVLRVARADHAQAREVPRLAQELPPGDERLQDEVAQVRVID